MPAPSSYTVKSPAGEQVEILTDEDWAELTGVPVTSVRKPFKSKLGLVRALWHEGAVEDKSGRATAKLHPRALEYGYQGRPVAITGAMSDPLNAPAFDRRTNGKRTYRIKLAAVPETWLMRMAELDTWGPKPDEPEQLPDLGEPVPVARIPDAAETLLEPSQGDRDAAALMESVLLPQEMLEPVPEYVPPLEPDPEPSPYLEVAPQVAMALLTQVVEIIAAGSPEVADQRVRKLTQEVTDIADKLSRRLQENDGLRRQVRSLGEELNAVKYERDGLRTRLRMTEHNLQQALKSDVMAHVNERVMRELEKVMRVAPSTTPRKGDPT